MKFTEMDEELLRLKLSHYFLPPIGIVRGNLQLPLNDAEREEQAKRMVQGLKALDRVESIVKNMVEEGEIRE